jgi:hypothetical protein
VFAQPKTGLAAGVVKALSKQLDAQVVTMSGALGTKVSVAILCRKTTRANGQNCSFMKI